MHWTATAPSLGTSLPWVLVPSECCLGAPEECVADSALPAPSARGLHHSNAQGGVAHRNRPPPEGMWARAVHRVPPVTPANARTDMSDLAWPSRLPVAPRLRGSVLCFGFVFFLVCFCLFVFAFDMPGAPPCHRDLGSHNFSDIWQL